MPTKPEKTEIIEREGQIALVLSDPSVKPWERNRVAEMTEYEGTDCWHLVDIRLKQFPQLSTWGCSTGGDDYHASFTPENEHEATMVKSKLREYREDADGSIHWCSFNGIVRGHAEIDGYSPPRYLNFDQSGYFSRAEGVEKLHEMKAFWDAHQGTLLDARIDNPYRQVGESEMRLLLTIERMTPGIKRDQALARVTALPRLQQQAGAAYTLYLIASKALLGASGDSTAVNWDQVHQDVWDKAVGQDQQPVAQVLDAIKLHSPGAVTPEQIATVEAMEEPKKMNDVTEPIGTQRVAKSPLQELEYRGENVALPSPRLSVGTVVCPTKVQATVNSSYFLKKIRSQIEADTLEIVDGLRRKHPSFNMGEVGDPLPAFNAAQVDAKMAIVLAPDSVEIAGHAPRAMHAVGVIGNQCYLEDGQCHGGLKYDAYLLFRKKIDSNMLVYVHPYAVVPEHCLEVVQVQKDNWWGINIAIDFDQERDSAIGELQPPHHNSGQSGP